MMCDRKHNSNSAEDNHIDIIKHNHRYHNGTLVHIGI